MFRFRWTGRVLTVWLLVLASASPSPGQTWTGTTNNQWNTATNWSSNPVVPTSGINTQLIFGTAPNTSPVNNIPGTFLLNRMTFDATAPAYNFSGNTLDFRTNSSALNPVIFQNSANQVTIGNNLVLTNTLTIGGNGVGTVTLSGTLSGAGGLNISGAGTVILGGGSNSFSGNVEVNSGTLSINTPTAIPGGRNISVRQGAVFRIGAASLSNASAPIGSLGLSGGTLRVPVGLAEYYLEQLTVLESGGIASAIDFSGSTNFRLHLTGTAGGVIVAGNTTWTGGGTSRIQNDRTTPIDILTSSTITNGIRLANGTNGQGFRFSGGGTLVQTDSGNSADLTVDNAVLEVANMANLGSGTILLQRTTAGLYPGAIKYTGATATSTKNLTLGANGGRIWVANANTNLTLSGSIDDGGALTRPLVVTGPGVLTLTGNNTYGGPTIVTEGGELSVSVINDGGIFGPLGMSLSDPAGLVLGSNAQYGRLRYTGTSDFTNRGVTFGDGTLGTIDITEAGTNLTITGQITGGSVYKAGLGTLTLSNGTNNFDGVVNISGGGALAIAHPRAIPASTDVRVGAGSEFRLAFSSGSNSGGAIDTITLNGGTLSMPIAGGSNYYVSRLEMSEGSRIDFTGSNSFQLRLLAGGVSVTGNANWIGGGASSILNETTSPLELSIAPGTTLTSSIKLTNGPSQQGFRITGGGTFAVTNTDSTATLIVDPATTLRIIAANALGSGSGGLFLNGGIFEYTGPTGNSFKSLELLDRGGTVSVTNPAAILNWTTAITGGFTLTKTGPGVLALGNTLHTLSRLVVDGGRVDVPSDSALGSVSITVNPAGTLRYTGNTTTSRTFTLNGGTLEAGNGAILTLNGAAANGGVLASAGGSQFLLTGSAAINGATLFGGTTVNVNGPAAFNNVTTGANVNVATGQTLTLLRGRQTASGSLTIGGIVTTPQGWESAGILRVNGGPTPGQFTVAGSSLVLGGGSRTYVGTNAAGQRGGTIDLGGGTLELNGGLLVNNGDFIALNNGGIQNGTVNVNYGGLAKGTGFYDAVNVTDGGKFAPGNSITNSTVGTLTLNSGSVYEFEINRANGTPGGGGTNPPIGWDLLSMLRLNVNSTPGSPAVIQLVSRNAADTGPGTLPDFDTAQSYRWLAFQAEVFSGFSPDKFTFDTSQFANLTSPSGIGTFAMEQSGSSVYVTYTPVPEPGLIVTIAVAGLVSGKLVRRTTRGARNLSQNPSNS